MTRPGTGTVFVLFTDIVSSTELQEKIGDEAMDNVRREHFQHLREAVDASAGEIVKTMGDGIMAVFVSGIDAIGAAVAMQEAVSNYNAQAGVHKLEMRVGLHAGEARREGDDYFGTPVVIAKRLCDLAAPAQILASDLVRALIGTRGSFRFRDAGAVSLKGIALPVPSKEIVWGAAAATPVAAAPASPSAPPPPPAASSVAPATPAAGAAAIGRGPPLLLIAGGAVAALVVFSLIAFFMLGPGEVKDDADPIPAGPHAVPGSTVIEDLQGDFNGGACDPARANLPCSRPQTYSGTPAPYLDIKTVRITQPDSTHIELSMTLYGPPPSVPELSSVSYFWQFEGGCLGDRTNPSTNKNALSVGWNGRAWSAHWSQIVDCTTLASVQGDAVEYRVSGDTISVRVLLSDLVRRSGEAIQWFAGVRLVNPAPQFPNTISLDLAPDVNAVNPSPPPLFLRPHEPATWRNK